MNLTAQEKQIIKAGKKYLAENNIEDFYFHLANNLNAQSVGKISNYFLEQGIDLLSYCKTEIPMCLYHSTPIESITIPNRITKIASYAFEECPNLKHVDIPDSVTEIGNGVFSKCPELKEICLPNSIKRIGAWAFYDDPNLIIYCEFDPRQIDWSWDIYKDQIIKI